MMKESDTDEGEMGPSATAVPEASPDENQKNGVEVEKPSAAHPSSRRLYLLIGAMLLVIAVVLCITLPLTLRDNTSGSNSSSSSSSQNSNSNSNSGGSGSNGNSNGNDDPMVVEVDTKKVNKVDSSNTLPLFGPTLMDGYSNSEDFESALQLALSREAQSFILRNTQQQQEQNGSPGRFEDMPEAMPMMQEDQALMAETAAAPTAAGAADSSGGGVTDFETNNQEENVDEADIIKADANFVYAAFGDYILIWDTAGNKVAQVAMPPIDLPDDWGKPYEDSATSESLGEDTVVASKEAPTTKSMMPPGGFWRPKPNIQSMLLTDNHLVAVVSGYNDQYSTTDQSISHVLYNYRASQIRLYQKLSNGNLTFVGSKNVNGNFVDARSIGDNVHLATATGVDTWTHLWQPLDRYNFGENITDENYQLQAAALAEKLIPAMSRQLREELQVNDDTGDLPIMLQVNQWMTVTNKTASGSSSSDGPGFDIPFDTYDVISNVAQVTSFNVNTPPTTVGGELMTSASAYMAPSYFDTLYGTEGHLVLATSGWNWNPSEGEMEQTTYLVALEVNDASTRFLSVGTLKGHLLNQYALDIVGDELRAATTVEHNQWGWWWPRPMPMMMDDVVMAVPVEATRGGSRKLQGNDKCGEPPEDNNGCSTADSYAECLELANAGCEVIIQTLMCPPSFSCANQAAVTAPANPDPNGLCPSVNSDCMDQNNYQDCINLVSDGCVSISMMESCPLQFSCGEYQDDNNIIDDDPQGLCRLPTEDCMNQDNYQDCLNLVRAGCTSIAELESCPLQFTCADDTNIIDPNGLCRLPTEDCMNQNNYQDCLDLVQAGCTSIAELESCPLQFQCASSEDTTVRPPTPAPTPEESRTKIYMIVLKLEGDNTPGLMSEKGRVQIGEANERITAVRFFDDVAYAVTFERTDPFYVLDMSVPSILGELKLPGFSSYLHSMNADNTLLLAVGENATEDGTSTGLMITVFDATNPAKPVALVSHTFESDPQAHSSSSVQWDYKSFRYVAGKLIIPLEIWYYQEWNEATQELEPLPDDAENFQGFAILDISTTSITEQYRISHMKEEGSCYYCNGYLPMRSFVYNGDLMTVRDNIVVSTVLNTGAEVWRLHLQVEGEPAECCW